MKGLSSKKSGKRADGAAPSRIKAIQSAAHLLVAIGVLFPIVQRRRRCLRACVVRSHSLELGLTQEFRWSGSRLSTLPCSPTSVRNLHPATTQLSFIAYYRPATCQTQLETFYKHDLFWGRHGLKPSQHSSGPG